MGSIGTFHSRIHISEIDEYLAAGLIEQGGGAFELSVSEKSRDGLVSVTYKKSSLSSPQEDGVDFELSPSEYPGLEDADIGRYLKKPVYSSSAYEFFDFALGYFSSLDSVVEFTGNAWKITILDSSLESS